MKTIFLIILFLFSITAVVYADTFQCRSEVGGYCIGLLENSNTISKNESRTGLAQVPGLEFLDIPSDAPIGDILAQLYLFGIWLVTISALVVLVSAGVKYMTAGDNQTRVSQAKTWIGNAIFGLVLALVSWLILYTINPELVTTLNLTLEKLGQPAGEQPGGEQPGSESLVACSTNIVGASPDTIISCGSALSSCTDVCDPSFCVPYSFCGKPLSDNLPSS